MPTRADYEQSANNFSVASKRISSVQSSVASIDAAQIIRGGSLGFEISKRLCSVVGAVNESRERIDSAAAICRRRAEMIAEFERRAHGYRQSYRLYVDQYRQWEVDLQFAQLYPEFCPHPGPPPDAPVRPERPPAWAELEHEGPLQ